MFDTGMLAADPLSAAGCGAVPSWIELVCPASPMSAWTEWGLGKI